MGTEGEHFSEESCSVAPRPLPSITITRAFTPEAFSAIALHLEKEFYESCYIIEILYHNESGSCRRVYRTVRAA